MKRFFVVFLLVLMFFALPLTLNADVVMGNDFFYENEDKTEDIGWEFFIINSSSGYVIPMDKPGSGKGVPSNRGYKTNIYGDVYDPPKYSIFVFNNGDYCGITAIYLYNGEYWGVMSPNHWYQPPGWILMDDLLMEYEREDFEKENENSFYTYTGSYDAVLSAEKLVIWQWPGSDKEKKVVEGKYTIQECANALYAYKDSEGREWGKTSYNEAWICLSDPENKTDIPAFYSAANPVKWSYDGIYDLTNEVSIWPPADPTAEVIYAATIVKSPVDSSKFSSTDEQVKSSVNSTEPSVADNQANMTLFIIIISVLVVGFAAIGLVLRAKTKKAKRDNT